MRGNWIRLVVGAVAVTLGGCTCDQPQPTCTDSTITFETPMSGASVDSPFEVSVNVKNADGSAFNIDAATLSVGGQSFTANVSGNRATFTGVAAAAGSQTLSVAIAKDTCSKTATSTITVRDTCSTPAVTGVDFLQDTEVPIGTLTLAELPDGTAMSFKVDAICVSDLQVRIKRGAAVIAGPVDFTNGSATLTAPTLPDGDGRYEVFAELLRGGVPVNTPSGNPNAIGRRDVFRTAPAVALNVASRYGPRDDIDPSTSGVQIRITGTAPVNSTCLLDIGGAPVNVVVSSMGTVGDVFTVTSGSKIAALVCTDAALNSGRATAAFVVDLDAPSLSITSPANVDGGATSVVTQSPLAITILTNAEDGSTVTANGNTAVVMNGTATVTVSFGADGTFMVAVSIEDTVGNRTTTVLTVDVSLAGCGAIFTRPGMCPALLTTADVSGGNYAFQTSSKPSCVGQPVALFKRDVLSDGGVTAETAVGTATLSSMGQGTFAPQMIASGSYWYRASVTNPGPDAGTSEVTCDVTVDLDGPAIVSPVRPSNAPYAIVNANQDGLPNVPGVQRPAGIGGLTFNARVPTGGRVDVCIDQQFDSASMMNRNTTPECGSGWYALQQGVVSPVDLFSFPEGQYQIKLAVSGGGTVLASPPLAILSDSIRPCLSSRTLPQDLNSDSKLNLAELDGGQPQVAFALGCGDAPASLAASNPVVLRDIVAGVPAGTRAATLSNTGGAYVATMNTGGTEIDLRVFVELTDLAGNRNLHQTTNDPSSFALRSDPVAPSCDIVSPAATQTLVGISGAPSGQFATQVSTSADVGTNGVRVVFGGTGRDLTPSNGSAQTNFAVSGTQTYAVTAVCTDGVGNSTTAPNRSITIDLDAPTCTLTAPTTGTYPSNRLLTTVSVAGAEGRPVTIQSDLQMAPITTSLVVSSGVANATLQFPKGIQAVTASVQDAAGNSCTPSTISGINVTSDACLLALQSVVVNSSGSWKNRSPASGLTSLTATSAQLSGVIANSADCRTGERVTLQRVSPTMGSLIELTTATNGDVVLSSAQTVNDGEVWTVTAYSSTATTTAADFRVGLAVPSITSLTLNGFQPATGTSIYFVATDDNFNLDPAFGTPKTDRYFADGNAASGAQAILALQGIAGMTYGTATGTVDVLYSGTTGALYSAALSAGATTLPNVALTLTHNTTGTFVVRLTSAAGNAADVYSSSTAVDVIAPGQPLMNALSLTNKRTATVDVSWSTVRDDGTDAASDVLTGGTPFERGYDLRWTTAAVYGNGQLATRTEFGGSSNVSSIVSAPTTLELPPLNTYYVVARARDEVGNYSAFFPATDTNAITKTQSLVNMWGGDVQVTVTSASSDFGTTVAAEGSVVGDSIADLVVASPGRGGAGSVYIFRGKNPFSGFSGACTGDCQELTAPDSLGTLFGGDVSTNGNVTDNTTESGVADIVVGQRGYSTTGRVFIFLGTRGTTVSQFVEIRGDASNTAIGHSARIISDIDGDGFDEVALSAFNFGSNRGRIYVFKGRALGDWPANPVAITAADWVIEGESILPADPVNTSNGLGLARLGLVTMPGYTGRTRADGGIAPELVVPLARTNLSKVVVYGYDRLRTSSVAAPLGVVDGGIQTISRTPAGTTNNNAFLGFGATSFAGPVLGSQDLFVGFPFSASVQYFSTWNSSGAPSGNNTGSISGPASFGGQVLAAELGGGASPSTDLLVVEGALSTNGAWVLYQRSGAFPSSVGGTAVRFWLSEFRPVRSAQVTVSATVLQTRGLTVGDLDGQGGPDLALSDSASGLVRVWR